MSHVLTIRALTRAAFAPFGDVIDCSDARHFPINEGWAERYHDLAALDLTGAGGRAAVSIVRTQARPEPVTLSVVERHRLGSQAFVPLAPCTFLIVVAPAGDAPSGPAALSAFITDGRQGVNYHAGVWHHPLLAIDCASDFLVIDRVAADPDCEELPIAAWSIRIELPRT